MAKESNNTAENKTAPARQKKSGGWFWFFLIVIIAAGGGGAYLANMPMAQKFAAKLGLPVAADTQEQPAPPSGEDTKTPSLPQTAVLPPDLHAPNAPYQPANETRQNSNAGSAVIADNAPDIDIAAQLASVHRRLDLMAQNDGDNARRWRQLQDRLYQLEQRSADNRGNGQSIQLVDIALRATGNASAAAASLESIAANAETEERRAFLLAESRRLRNIPDRRHITDAIYQLRALLRELGDIPADAKPANAVVAMIFSLLKVQKITTAQSRARDLDDALARMEWLVIVGRDEAYLRELTAAADGWQNAKDTSDNGDIARLFGQLQEMGAPRYKLGAGAAL